LPPTVLRDHTTAFLPAATAAIHRLKSAMYRPFAITDRSLPACVFLSGAHAATSWLVILLNKNGSFTVVC
jgi:hypothetical protein